MRVKIHLDKGQSQEAAEEQLLKAIGAQHSGEAHSHPFPDEGTNHVAEQVQEKHARMMESLQAEILSILSEVA